MQMIKGTDIKLYKNSGYEIIKNVLVGEPSIIDSEIGNSKILTYTIAIPKGDSNIWTDKKIEVFGKLFRTVGLEIQGIEENIPLCWHKKIRIDFMAINGGFTVYDSKNFSRHIYNDVLIYDNRDSAKNKVGELKKGSLDIHVYAVNNPDFTWFPANGDYIVKGICPFEFDVSDEKKISESMNNFRKNYPDFAVINSCEKKFFGAFPDLIISAR